LSSNWQKYQTEVADLFSGLGLEVSQEQRIQGIRAAHRIDVCVRGDISGFSFTWIVECKATRRPVEKAAVLTLKGVVDDLGGDRGFLVSEAGFQPGAIAVAQSTNMTLTNFSSLRDVASDAFLKRRFDALDAALDLRYKRVMAFHEFTVWPPEHRASTEFLGAINWLQWDYWRTALEIVRSGVQRVRLDKWPVPVEDETQAPYFSVQGPSLRRVETLSEFVPAAEVVLDRVDVWLDRSDFLMSLGDRKS
jgi:hypothetical protein